MKNDRFDEIGFRVFSVSLCVLAVVAGAAVVVALWRMALQ